MYYTGFADEAGSDLDVQIKATKELGWSHIETRKLFDSNLAFISDEQFDIVSQKLNESGIKFNCFGSGVANWQKYIEDSPESSYEELKLAIPRMQKLDIEMIRIMSFPVRDLSKFDSYKEETVKRMKHIAKMAEDGGITCVIENCSGWGAGSCEHMVELLEAIDSPNMKLVFDTGNPVYDIDIRCGEPFTQKQTSWEFYQHVKDFIAYIHIKDGFMDNGKEVYTFPGEGHGEVERILADLFANGYDGGISIEPHMEVVFHDDSVTSNADSQFNNYVEYGKRLMAIVDRIKTK